jgi:hypothetical protein
MRTAPGRATSLASGDTGDTVSVQCCLDAEMYGHVALYAPIPGITPAAAGRAAR